MNAVVLGKATSTNTQFKGNDWDFISAGNQSQFNFYQTFMGYSDRFSYGGTGPNPIYVSDHNVNYGVLAVETTRSTIIVNGMNKAGSRACGNRDPRPL
jgi:hypothetical protein